MNIAIVLAGGTGTRLGEQRPKQYIEVNGKPIIGYCLDTLFADENLDAVQIVADPVWQTYIEDYIEQKIAAKEYADSKWKGFSVPGTTRQLSIWNALQDICAFAPARACVMIHDAARPLLSHSLIARCFQCLRGHDGVLPVLPMKDTVYYSEGGNGVTSLLDRDRLYAGQAPEVFRLAGYYAANQILLPDRILDIHGSSEPAVMAGMDIAMTEGDERNFKITTKEDLRRFREMLRERGTI